MNSKVNYAIMFITGAVLGASGGYFFAKKKYEQIANEEIESTKEAFNEKNDELVEKVTTLSEEAAEKLIAEKGDSPMDYMNKFKSEPVVENKEIRNVFEEYASIEVTPKKQAIPVAPTPYVGNDPIYVINPEEYGNIDGYELISLTLSRDGYLLDYKNEIIDDPAGAVGDCLAMIGEYEDDAVHVRNDIRQCDYEVLQDLRPLNEIINN